MTEQVVRRRRSRSEEVVGASAAAREWTGVKVFSVTKARERADLGDRVTAWLRETGAHVVEYEVRQSSDSEFHALTIVLFYKEEERP